MTHDIVLYQVFANIVLIAHFVFIVFVLCGGLLLLRWQRIVWIHLPSVFWVIVVEVTGIVCPLTPLENYFRARSGADIYHGDFIGHYLWLIIYPAELTTTIQLMLAGVVIAFNLIIYAVIIRVRSGSRQDGQHGLR